MKDPEILRMLVDRFAIVDVVDRIATAADLHQWETLLDCFTEEVEVDYTALTGGKPETMRADLLVERWKGLLSGFKTTQHMLANHSVEVHQTQATATCTAQFQATRYLPDTSGCLWVFVGHYCYELTNTRSGWRVCKTTMTATLADGNQHLRQLASVS